MSKIQQVVIVGSRMMGVAQRMRALITSTLAMVRTGDDKEEIEAELLRLRKTLVRFEDEVRSAVSKED